MKLEIVLLATLYSPTSVSQVVVQDFDTFEECEATAEKVLTDSPPNTKTVYQCTYGGVVEGPVVPTLPGGTYNGDNNL